MSYRPTRILLLDDELRLRDSLADALEDAGHTVLTADAAEDAFRLLQQIPIDAAVLELRLPGMDGPSFISAAAPRYPDLKFIILTASLDFELDDTLRSCGVRDDLILRKPLPGLDTLTSALELALTGESPAD